MYYIMVYSVNQDRCITRWCTRPRPAEMAIKHMECLLFQKKIGGKYRIRNAERRGCIRIDRIRMSDEDGVTGSSPKDAAKTKIFEIKYIKNRPREQKKENESQLFHFVGRPWKGRWRPTNIFTQLVKITSYSVDSWMDCLSERWRQLDSNGLI